MGNLVEGFFYGLYMDIELLESLGFKPVSTRMGHAESYELDLKGMAKIIPREGSQVWGMLITLDESDLDAMYSFETTVDYKPEKIQVTLGDGHQVTVPCFNVPPDSNAAFNTEYLEKLIPVVTRLGLPDKYINTLKMMC